jgi:hypothetical protein
MKMYGQKNIKLGNCSVQIKEDGHVTRMGEKRVLVWNPKKIYHSDDLVVDGSIILRRMLKIRYGKEWTVFIWLRIGKRDGSL